MNGVHDMGGMQWHGADSARAQRADVSRALGRTRVCALARAANPPRSVEPRCVSPWPRGICRPAEYLRMSYYERWFAWMHDDPGRRGRGHAGGDREWETRDRLASKGRAAARAGGGLLDGRPPRFGAGATSLSLHDSSRDSACARATSIHQGTRDCRVMREARAASSIAITACSSFPTPTRISTAKSRSMSIRCDSPRANSGAIKRRRATRSSSPCGTTTLSAV